MDAGSSGACAGGLSAPDALYRVLAVSACHIIRVAAAVDLAVPLLIGAPAYSPPRNDSLECAELGPVL